MASTPLKSIYSSGNIVGVKNWSNFSWPNPSPPRPPVLLSRLQEDMKTAMKSGQKERLGVIRMLLSDVKNIDLASKPTTAEQAVEAYAKKLRKSLEEYEKLGRTAEVTALKFEIGVVDEYLPKKASAEDAAKLVDAFLRRTRSRRKISARRSACS